MCCRFIHQNTQADSLTGPCSNTALSHSSMQLYLRYIFHFHLFHSHFHIFFLHWYYLTFLAQAPRNHHYYSSSHSWKYIFSGFKLNSQECILWLLMQLSVEAPYCVSHYSGFTPASSLQNIHKTLCFHSFCFRFCNTTSFVCQCIQLGYVVICLNGPY